MIHSWSHSRVVDFEKCKHMAFLKYDKRIPEPERPLPPGKTEHANDRGTRVHNGIELYASSQSDNFPFEAKWFRAEIECLRDLYSKGRASFEGEWGYNRDWEPTEWKSAWLRMKLDAIVHISDEEAVVIDYKTGKVFGNEIKHGEQTMLYQLSSFLRYPKLEIVHTELWYLDHNQMSSKTFTRDQGLRFKASWDRRGNAITTCEEFPPNSNRYSCQYCPYGMEENGFPQGTGHCAAGRRR